MTETVFHPGVGVCTAITISNNVVAFNRTRARGNGGRTIFNETSVCVWFSPANARRRPRKK